MPEFNHQLWSPFFGGKIRELTPSCFLGGGKYSLYQVKPNQDYEETGGTYPSIVSEELAHGLTDQWRSGFHYLVFARRLGVIQCEFRFASDTTVGHDIGDIVYGLDVPMDLDDVYESGVLMADELDRFVASMLPKKNAVGLDKPLSTRERDTLLTIIAALAKLAKIDTSQPGKAALAIEGMTDELGAHVSKRAIEDHLKKIPDALEIRMK